MCLSLSFLGKTVALFCFKEHEQKNRPQQGTAFDSFSTGCNELLGLSIIVDNVKLLEGV